MKSRMCTERPSTATWACRTLCLSEVCALTLRQPLMQLHNSANVSSRRQQCFWVPLGLQYCHSNFSRLPKAPPVSLCSNTNLSLGWGQMFSLLPVSRISKALTTSSRKKKAIDDWFICSKFSPLWNHSTLVLCFNSSLMALHISLMFNLSFVAALSSRINAFKFLSKISSLALFYFLYTHTTIFLYSTH